MKIICIGRNYAAHAAELNNRIEEEPVVFLKPETAIIPGRQVFFLPSFSDDIHHEIELVVKIQKLGRNISEKFAHRYYSEVTLGIDFTARDLQSTLKKAGLPWEKAKAFDHSAPTGTFIPLSEIGNIDDLHFELRVNGELRQSGHSAMMLFPVDRLIAHVSRYFTLKKGDLLFTGTPAGVSAVRKEDHLEGFLEGKKLLDLHVK